MSKNLKMCTLLACYGNILPQKQRLFCECYYNEDLSLVEIAENEGLTKQGVRDAIKRAEKKLIDTEKSLRIVEKSDKLKELARICRDNNNEQHFATLFEAIDNL